MSTLMTAIIFNVGLYYFIVNPILNMRRAKRAEKKYLAYLCSAAEGERQRQEAARARIDATHNQQLASPDGQAREKARADARQRAAEHRAWYESATPEERAQLKRKNAAFY